MRFAIYGIGGFGREIAPIASALAQTEPSDSCPVIFVNDQANGPSDCNGLPVIGFADLSAPAHRDRAVIAAVGDGRTRAHLEQRCEAAGLRIGTLQAPTARVLEGNEIGRGAVLCDFTMVTANAKIGKSFQANIYSYVAHDCIIGDYVTFAPRVSCNGTIEVGDFAYVGTGATFVQGTAQRPLRIGEGAFVGMGAVVTKAVEPYTLVAGNPARVIRSLRRP